MTIAHIFNGELGFDVRTKLNDVIDIANAAGSGGMAIGGSITSATAGSVLFAGAAGVLAQDNAHFFWDGTNYRLKIGTTGTLGSYYLNGVPALYEVPHVSGSNWFEGNAGNTSVTGYGNFGTGDGVLSNLTTGSGNVALGGISTLGGAVPSMYYNTTGDSNLAVGSSALMSNTIGHFNVAVGNAAMAFGVENHRAVALGFSVFKVLGQSGYAATYGNIGIGYGTAGAINTGDNNIIIGTGTAPFFTSGQMNTIVGSNAFQYIYGACNYNTWIGGYFNSVYIGSGINDTIIVAGGRDDPKPGLDRGFTTQVAWTGSGYGNNIWSFNPGPGIYNAPVGLHVYNVSDGSPGPVNYERAMFDWNIMPNVLTIGTQAGGSGTKRNIAIDGFAKAGAPAAGDLPASSFSVIDDTSGGATWLVFNKGGTIRKVQLV